MKKTISTGVDGSYEWLEGDSETVEPGTYSVKTTISGKTVENKSVVVEANKTTTCDLEYDNTVTVTFKTDIKDYGAMIKINSGDNTVVELQSKTYKYTIGNTLNGVPTKNARDESITHRVEMPKGSYTFSFTSDKFKLVNAEGNDLTGFTLSGKQQEVEIFVQSKVSLEDPYITDTVEPAAEALGSTPVESYVKRGTYTLKGANESAETAANIEFSISSDPKDTTPTGMAALGKTYKFEDDESGALEIANGKGYVVFQIAEGESYIAKIQVANAAFTLINLDGKQTINGTQKIASIDSRYSEYTVSLGAGKYALVTNTEESSKSSDKNPKVTSITFQVESAFKIEADKIKNYDGDPTKKLVVAAYDATNNSVGTSGYEDYDKFAIFIAKNPKYLTYDNINNITQEGDGIVKFQDDGTAIDSDGVTKSYDGGAEPGVIKITSDSKDGTYIFRAETEAIYDRVRVSASEDITIPNKYVYAVVVEGIERDPIYAIGGAMPTGSSRWLIEDNEAHQIN